MIKSEIASQNLVLNFSNIESWIKILELHRQI